MHAVLLVLMRGKNTTETYNALIDSVAPRDANEYYLTDGDGVCQHPTDLHRIYYSSWHGNAVLEGVLQRKAAVAAVNHSGQPFIGAGWTIEPKSVRILTQSDTDGDDDTARRFGPWDMKFSSDRKQLIVFSSCHDRVFGVDLDRVRVKAKPKDAGGPLLAPFRLIAKPCHSPDSSSFRYPNCEYSIRRIRI